MINVLLFARVRELAGTDGVTVAAEYSDAESLRLALSLKDSRWAMALEQGSCWWPLIRPWCRSATRYRMATKLLSFRRSPEVNGP